MSQLARVFDRSPALDATVTDSTRERIARAVPESTRRVYAGDLDRFRAWCAGTGRAVSPATAETLAEYASHLCDEDRAPSTIERALAAIRTAHRAAGLELPDTIGARMVLRAHRQDRADAGKRTRKASPVTVAALRALVASCDPSTTAGVRDRALVVLGFALGTRRSELVALDLVDIQRVDEGLLVVVRRSKTDQDAAGREVAVPYGANPATCPVRAFRAWQDTLERAGHVDGPVFRRVDRHGRIGGRLTGQAVALILRRIAQAAGLPDVDLVSGHSLRRGFATEARRGGADLVAVARHGGWQDGSRALLGYFQEVDRWTENPLVGVGL